MFVMDAPEARGATFAPTATPAVLAVPIELELNTTSKLPGLRVGSLVPFTVKVTALRKIGKLHIGFPQTGEVFAASRPLLRPNKDAGPYWNVGALTNGQTKILTFKVRVDVPPEDAAGDNAPWCMVALSAPSLLKGPPSWIKTETLCLTIPI